MRDALTLEKSKKSREYKYDQTLGVAGGQTQGLGGTGVGELTLPP